MQRDRRSLVASLPAVALLAGAFQTSCDRLCTDRLRQMWFELSLTPSQVVPPPDAPGVGSGDLELQEQGNERSIIFAVRAVPRSDPGAPNSFDTQTVTAVHIHQGAAGMNGPLLWSVPDAPTGDIVYSRFDYDGTIPWDDLWTTLETEPAYLDVHTTTFPDGQIRGALADRNLHDWYCPSWN